MQAYAVSPKQKADKHTRRHQQIVFSLLLSAKTHRLQQIVVSLLLSIKTHTQTPTNCVFPVAFHGKHTYRLQQIVFSLLLSMKTHTHRLQQMLFSLLLSMKKHKHTHTHKRGSEAQQIRNADSGSCSYPSPKLFIRVHFLAKTPGARESPAC